MLSYNRQRSLQNYPMSTHIDFAKTYENMSDGQLLQTANEGGFVDEAKQALANELLRRNLRKSDLVHHKESPRARLRQEATEREFPVFLFTQSQAMTKMPIAATKCRLLRSPARSSNAKHHLCAAVQLDILLGAEQDVGSLSHPGILLPRRIVRQQHAGNGRGGDGDAAGSGYDGPRRRSAVSCGSPGVGTSAWLRATRPATAISSTCARVGRSTRHRTAHGAGPAGRCRTARRSDRLNLGMNWQVLPALQFEVVKLERHLGIVARCARFRGEHMTHQLRSLRNLGSVGSLY
jgi:hypothetical protein